MSHMPKPQVRRDVDDTRALLVSVLQHPPHVAKPRLLQICHWAQTRNRLKRVDQRAQSQPRNNRQVRQRRVALDVLAHVRLTGAIRRVSERGTAVAVSPRSSESANNGVNNRSTFVRREAGAPWVVRLYASKIVFMPTRRRLAKARSCVNLPLELASIEAMASETPLDRLSSGRSSIVAQ